MTYALRTCKDGDLFGLRWKRDERAVVPSYASEGTRKPTSGGSKSSYSRRLCRPSFFQDETKLETNPKVGFCWMRRGKQKPLRTPGTNRKVWISGALNFATGRLHWVSGRRRD